MSERTNTPENPISIDDLSKIRDYLLLKLNSLRINSLNKELLKRKKKKPEKGKWKLLYILKLIWHYSKETVIIVFLACLFFTIGLRIVFIRMLLPAKKFESLDQLFNRLLVVKLFSIRFSLKVKLLEQDVKIIMRKQKRKTCIELLVDEQTPLLLKNESYLSSLTKANGLTGFLPKTFTNMLNIKLTELYVKVPFSFDMLETVKIEANIGEKYEIVPEFLAIGQPQIKLTLHQVFKREWYEGAISGSIGLFNTEIPVSCNLVPQNGEYIISCSEQQTFKLNELFTSSRLVPASLSETIKAPLQALFNNTDPLLQMSSLDIFVNSGFEAVNRAIFSVSSTLELSLPGNILKLEGLNLHICVYQPAHENSYTELKISTECKHQLFPEPIDCELVYNGKYSEWTLSFSSIETRKQFSASEICRLVGSSEWLDQFDDGINFAFSIEQLSLTYNADFSAIKGADITVSCQNTFAYSFKTLFIQVSKLHYNYNKRTAENNLRINGQLDLNEKQTAIQLSIPFDDDTVHIELKNSVFGMQDIQSIINLSDIDFSRLIPANSFSSADLLQLSYLGITTDKAFSDIRQISLEILQNKAVHLIGLLKLSDLKIAVSIENAKGAWVYRKGELRGHIQFSDYKPMLQTDFPLTEHPVLKLMDNSTALVSLQNISQFDDKAELKTILEPLLAPGSVAVPEILLNNMKFGFDKDFQSCNSFNIGFSCPGTMNLPNNFGVLHEVKIDYGKDNKGIYLTLSGWLQLGKQGQMAKRIAVGLEYHFGTKEWQFELKPEPAIRLYDLDELKVFAPFVPVQELVHSIVAANDLKFELKQLTLTFDPSFAKILSMDIGIACNRNFELVDDAIAVFFEEIRFGIIKPTEKEALIDNICVEARGNFSLHKTVLPWHGSLKKGAEENSFRFTLNDQDCELLPELCQYINQPTFSDIANRLGKWQPAQIDALLTYKDGIISKWGLESRFEGHSFSFSLPLFFADELIVAFQLHKLEIYKARTADWEISGSGAVSMQGLEHLFNAGLIQNKVNLFVGKGRFNLTSNKNKLSFNFCIPFPGQNINGVLTIDHISTEVSDKGIEFSCIAIIDLNEDDINAFFNKTTGLAIQLTAFLSSSYRFKLSIDPKGSTAVELQNGFFKQSANADEGSIRERWESVSLGDTTGFSYTLPTFSYTKTEANASGKIKNLHAAIPLSVIKSFLKGLQMGPIGQLMPSSIELPLSEDTFTYSIRHSRSWGTYVTVVPKERKYIEISTNGISLKLEEFSLYITQSTVLVGFTGSILIEQSELLGVDMAILDAAKKITGGQGIISLRIEKGIFAAVSGTFVPVLFDDFVLVYDGLEGMGIALSAELKPTAGGEYEIILQLADRIISFFSGTGEAKDVGLALSIKKANISLPQFLGKVDLNLFSQKSRLASAEQVLETIKQCFIVRPSISKLLSLIPHADRSGPDSVRLGTLKTASAWMLTSTKERTDKLPSDFSYKIIEQHFEQKADRMLLLTGGKWKAGSVIDAGAMLALSFNQSAFDTCVHVAGSIAPNPVSFELTGCVGLDFASATEIMKYQLLMSLNWGSVHLGQLNVQFSPERFSIGGELAFSVPGISLTATVSGTLCSNTMLNINGTADITLLGRQASGVAFALSHKKLELSAELLGQTFALGLMHENSKVSCKGSLNYRLPLLNGQGIGPVTVNIPLINKALTVHKISLNSAIEGVLSIRGNMENPEVSFNGSIDFLGMKQSISITLPTLLITPDELVKLTIAFINSKATQWLTEMLSADLLGILKQIAQSLINMNKTFIDVRIGNSQADSLAHYSKLEGSCKTAYSVKLLNQNFITGTLIKNQNSLQMNGTLGFNYGALKINGSLLGNSRISTSGTATINAKIDLQLYKVRFNNAILECSQSSLIIRTAYLGNAVTLRFIKNPVALEGRIVFSVPVGLKFDFGKISYRGYTRSLGSIDYNRNIRVSMHIVLNNNRKPSISFNGSYPYSGNHPIRLGTIDYLPGSVNDISNLLVRDIKNRGKEIFASKYNDLQNSVKRSINDAINRARREAEKMLNRATGGIL